MTRRVLICLAFATWCFFNTWVQYAEGQPAYFSRYDPLWTVAVPIVCWVALIALAMLGTWQWLRFARMDASPYVHGLFLATCLVPLGIAATAALRVVPFDPAPIVRSHFFLPVVVVAGITAAGLAIRNPRRVSRAMQSLFLWSWPVLLTVLFQAGRHTLFHDPAASYADGVLAARLPAPPRDTRVVWIIFDELSQAIAFDHRPPGLALPNFDRFQSESFHASMAQAPDVVTEKSMPGLILGEKVMSDEPRGPASLYLTTPSHPTPFAWNEAPNVFDRARKLGFNTGLVGWYHPYGRVLNRSLTKCYWIAQSLGPGIEEPFRPRTLLSEMWMRARMQFSDLPLAGRLRGLSPLVYDRREKIEQFSYLLDRSIEMVTDPNIGLVLLHLPIPHPPAIYNRSRGAVAVDGSIGYLDGVAQADATLGTLRRKMEETGQWERTAVLISADHGWRTNVWRGGAEWTPEEEAFSHSDTSGIPFLLKLPQQRSWVFYDRPFGTLVTQGLILDILSGGLTDPGSIPREIERVGSTTK